ncbi:MAG: SgcJ/EcaC family oxidoreductase [Bryobacteraceae bacterium]
MKVLLIPASAFVFLTACVQSSAPTPDTHAADEQAIRAQETAAQQAWAAKDTEKVASLYADDATVTLANTPVMTGRQAIADGFKQAGTDPNFSLAIDTTSVEASGDLGYARGSYAVHATDPTTKKVVLEKGHYLMVYKKQADGSWKIVSDSAVPEAPATPVAQ